MIVVYPQSPRTLESKVLAEGTWKGTFAEGSVELSGFHAPRNDVAFRGFCLFALKVMSQYFKLSVALDCSRLLSIALGFLCYPRYFLRSSSYFWRSSSYFSRSFKTNALDCSRLLSITLDCFRSLSMTHGIMACTLTVQTMPRGLPFWGPGRPKVLT